MAEAADLAGDALVAPTRVLAGESQDKLPDLGGQCRPADSPCPTAEGGPAAMHEGTVPAEDSLGSDNQLRPGVAAEANEQRRQHKSIAGFQIRACDLSLKDANLVAKNQQLSVAIVGRTRARRNEHGVEEESEAGVDEGGEHWRRRS